MPELLALTGATGNQGGAVARALLADGWPLRALVRNPDKPAARALADKGVELVRADLEDRESLDRALEGAHGLYSMQNFWEHGAEAEVRQGKTLHEAAKAAGVQHVVFSSVGGADRDTGVSHFESKRKIEAHLRTLDIPITIFRPAFFMDNLMTERYRVPITNGVFPFALRPDRRLQMIACEDVGVLVALAFQRADELIGHASEVAFDEATPAEVCDRLSERLGKPVQQIQPPIEKLREIRPDLAEMFEWFESDGYVADIEACRKLHPGGLSMADWIRKRWEPAATEEGA